MDFQSNLGIIFIFLCCVRISSCFNITAFNIAVRFEPKAVVEVLEGGQHNINFTIMSLKNTKEFHFLKVKFCIDDDDVAELVGERIVLLNQIIGSTNSSQESPLLSGNITVKGNRLGYTKLKISIEENNKVSDSDSGSEENSDASDSNSKSNEEEEYPDYKITVLRKMRTLDFYLPILVVIVMVFANFVVGCNVEFDTIKENLRSPKVLIVAIICKMIIMPVVAFGVISLLDIHGSVSIGLFAYGCSPTATSGPMYAQILYGDLSLGAMVTILTTLCSFVVTPIWILTLGQYIISKEEVTQFKIPFLETYLVLCLALVPLGLGMLLKKFKPELTSKTSKHLRLFFSIILLLGIALTIFTVWYVFQFFTGKIVLAGFLVPGICYLIGGIATAFLRQPIGICVTVAVVTGLQNVPIGTSLILLPLDPPERDLAMVGGVAILLFQAVPLWIAAVIVIVKKKMKNKDEDAIWEKLNDSFDRKQNEKNTLTEKNRLVD